MFDALVEAANRKAEAEAWTTEHELLASLTEWVHALWATTVRVNSSKKVNIEPLRIPRPGVRDEAPRAVSPSDLAMLLTTGG
jgi:hypothetical protein